MKIARLLPAFAALILSVSPTLAAQAQPQPDRMPGHTPQQRRELMRQLSLTDAQKSQMRQIREQTHNRIRALLTPEQQAKWDAGRQPSMKPRYRLEALNLSETQKQSIKQIMRDSRQQMKALLTSEQRDRVEQFKPRRLDRFQSRSETQLQPDLSW